MGLTLGMSTREEMEAAYQGEVTTPSRCGRMDQACAYGPGRPVLLTFDGDHLSVGPAVQLDSAPRVD